MTDAQRDKYYRKKYGVGLDWYNRTLAEQGGCAGCGNSAKNILLSVDHCHQWKYIKIQTFKLPSGRWGSKAEYWGMWYFAQEDKKNLAIREIRRQLKIASVRGILCFLCNGSLRKLRNNPQIAENLAIYLRKHQNAKMD